MNIDGVRSMCFSMLYYHHSHLHWLLEASLISREIRATFEGPNITPELMEMNTISEPDPVS